MGSRSFLKTNICRYDVHHCVHKMLLIMLQLSSALPLDANIYGLGEVIASSGFRRDVRGTIQTMWNRDEPDPLDQNMYVSIILEHMRHADNNMTRYGSHPVYLEHRFDQDTGKSDAHGVFLFRSVTCLAKGDEVYS
jgi:alpha-glucosidase